MVKRFSLRSAFLAFTFVCLAVGACSYLFFNRLTGEPSWLSVGPNVYHFRDVATVQKETHSFSNADKWFETIPKTPWHEIPTDVDGSKLNLEVDCSPVQRRLNFRVTLDAAKKIERKYEHRYNNLFPLLFAVFVDGVAVKQPTSGISKFGGDIQFRDLVDAGESKTWDIHVDPQSLDSLLTGKRHRVTIVVAFCERAHENFHSHSHSLGLAGLDLNYKKTDPSLVVRSKPVTFTWLTSGTKTNKNSAE